MNETSMVRTDGRQEVARLVPDAGMDIETLAGHLAKSGYFKDAADASKCVVKVLYGRELGFPAIASMLGVHIIEGKPVCSATMMASMVRRSGVYDYRVLEMSDTRCEIAWFQRGERVGTTVWTIQDATRAGLANKQVWKSYPRSMLFSRAVGEGVRTYFPDLFGGAPAYTVDEARDEARDGEWETPVTRVDTQTGEVIEVKATVEPQPVQPRHANRVAALTERHASYAAATGCPPDVTGAKAADVPLPKVADAPMPPGQVGETDLGRFNRLWSAAGRENKARGAYALRVLGRRPESPDEWMDVADDFAQHATALKYAMAAYGETGADANEDGGGVMRAAMMSVLDRPVESRRDCTAKELREFGAWCREQGLPRLQDQRETDDARVGMEQKADDTLFDDVAEHPRSALVTGS